MQITQNLFKDNIGDNIHQDLDCLVELMREREAPELVNMARDRDMVRRITETNNILLGDDPLIKPDQSNHI